MSPGDEKRQLIEAELKRLEVELGVLERQWNRKHYLALFGLLTIPAYFYWGIPALMLGVLATPSLVLTQAYLIGVRRSECRELIAESEQRLKRLSVTPKPTPAG